MAYGEVYLTKRDIETKLATVGDYVKIDFLMQCLKKNLDFETKKFVMVKLADVYEGKKMFLEAGKLIRAAADINTTFDGKLKDFMRSMDIFIKAGSFDEAEVSFSKAIASSNERQKMEIRQTRKAAVKTYAEDHLKKDRRRQAMDAYELLLSFDLLPAEKQDTQKKLLGLYEKLGKVKEFGALRQAMQNPAAASSTSVPPRGPSRTMHRPPQQPSKPANDSLDEILGL